MTHTESQQNCMENPELWTASPGKGEHHYIKPHMTLTQNIEIQKLWTWASVCLMNANRGHMGAINDCSQVMKQLSHSRKWSVHLNRNVTLQ